MIVPLPVKPQGEEAAKCQCDFVDQNLEYAETDFKVSRHRQCPIFPGEWVSQSGGLKDLGNSFWANAVQLTACLTTGALRYQQLHGILVSPPTGEK